MYFDNLIEDPVTICFGNGKETTARITEIEWSPLKDPEIHGFLLHPLRTSKVEKDESIIKNVIFNYPATIVIWSDDTKTVVKCQPGDTYDAEKGLALCIAKKFFGNKGNFNEVFKKWVPEDLNISVVDMKAKIKSFCDSTNCSKCPIYILPGRAICAVGCWENVEGKALIENYNAIKWLI